MQIALTEKFHRICFLSTLTHTVGERSSEFGGVNTTEGRLSVLDRPCGRELKEYRDEIGWDSSINKRAYL